MKPLYVCEEGLGLNGIQAQIKFLSGTILTIVDASYSDITQREAVKSMVKSEVSRSLDYIKKLSQAYEVRAKKNYSSGESCSSLIAQPAN